MSNISTLIEAIRNAVYGREVRSSIADAIEDISERQDIADANEVTRQDNEEEREDSEAQRVTNESGRASAETARGNEFNAIKSDYNDAIANMESKTFKYEEGFYTSTEDGLPGFYLNATSFNPITDTVELYYSDGTKMTRNKEYTISGTLITLLGWVLDSDDFISWIARKGSSQADPPGTNGADIMDGSIRKASLELSVQNDINAIGDLRTNGITSEDFTDTEVTLDNDIHPLIQNELDRIDAELDDRRNHLTCLIPVHKTFTEIQTLVSGGGKFKFAKGTFDFGMNTLLIGDNTVIESNRNTVIKSSNAVVMKVTGDNVKIFDSKIDLNQTARCGIVVQEGCFNVEINNIEVGNAYSTTHALYGIYVSAFQCDKIDIKNCYIHDIVSVGDGSAGTRLGGWAKGICIDIYDTDMCSHTSVIDYPTTEPPPISKNITIDNNLIMTIGDAEDADGIYFDGFRNYYDTNVKIINNKLYNCAKRAIKVLPSKGVFIDGNYMYNETTVGTAPMQSFISCYGTDFTISNNRGIIKGGSTDHHTMHYAIEFAYNPTSYGTYEVGNVEIFGNKLDVEFGDVGIFKSNTVTTDFKNIKIHDNVINGTLTEGIYLRANATTGTLADLIEVKNNTILGAMLYGIYLMLPASILIVDNNDLLCTAINDIYVQGTSGDVFTEVHMNNNYLPDSTGNPIKIDYATTVTLVANRIKTPSSSVAGYYLTNNTSKLIRANIDLRNMTFISEINFATKTITTNPYSLDVTGYNNVCTMKLMLSTITTTTITDLTGNQGQVVTLCTPVTTNTVTINPSTVGDIHFKTGATSLTLGSEQSVTLIRLDTRWVEIARNF